MCLYKLNQFQVLYSQKMTTKRQNGTKTHFKFDTAESMERICSFFPYSGLQVLFLASNPFHAPITTQGTKKPDPDEITTKDTYNLEKGCPYFPYSVFSSRRRLITLFYKLALLNELKNNFSCP